jgi:hypothetical protein
MLDRMVGASGGSHNDETMRFSKYDGQISFSMYHTHPYSFRCVASQYYYVPSPTELKQLA